MKRVRDAIIWMTLLTGISALLFFSVRRKVNAEVKTLVVKIDPIDGNQRMISEAEVTKKVEGHLGFKIEQVNIRKIDTRALEESLNEDSRIDVADVYFDSKDRLTVWIRQRKPIMRVVDRNNISYYLDVKGEKVPTIVSGAIRVPLVTGDLESYQPDMIHSDKKSKLKEVFEIMKYVDGDEFLSALIEQVHVEEGTGEIFMIPKIGREKLIFGGAENMEEKFDKLKIFYRDGLPRLGWSKYSALNLKVTDQVVCTLR
ncbi:MAG: hypothetical protein IPM42_15855 [Saprospiraceae bacterium]|nr:hypothetical protein [Saprospiraceae bacterium]